MLLRNIFIGWIHNIYNVNFLTIGYSLCQVHQSRIERRLESIESSVSNLEEILFSLVKLVTPAGGVSIKTLLCNLLSSDKKRKKNTGFLKHAGVLCLLVKKR